jgi:single-strand DNA-binding protein
MAGSLNKVTLIGNVGKDPEIRSTQDGREIASFPLATSDSWKDKNSGERKEKTEWHRVVIFSPGLVNVIKNHVKKGSKLYLEGALQTRKWTDQAGHEKYSTEVVLQAYNGTLVMLDGKSGNGHDHDNHHSLDHRTPSHLDDKGKASYDIEHIDDEIPF